jgi:deazaflavin-dependent oxidoreductase (nitroreductase family)
MAFRRYSSYLGRRARVDEAILERFVTSPLGTVYTMRLAPRIDKRLIPWTGGRFSSLGANRVGMLTSTGAKSGTRHTNPVGLIDIGDGLLAIGSNYGRPSHPSWSANLVAHPECEVEFRSPRAPYRAQLLAGDERAQAWETAVDYFAGFSVYANRCAPRQIRVFRLIPAS